jgi:hypothetical protein
VAYASRYRALAFQPLADHAQWGTRQLEHRAIVDAFEAYDAAAATGWDATHLGRAAIVEAGQIDPDRPLSRVHDLLERYTGSRILPEYGER